MKCQRQLAGQSGIVDYSFISIWATKLQSIDYKGQGGVWYDSGSISVAFPLILSSVKYWTMSASKGGQRTAWQATLRDDFVLTANLPRYQPGDRTATQTGLNTARVFCTKSITQFTQCSSIDDVSARKSGWSLSLIVGTLWQEKASGTQGSSKRQGLSVLRF